MTTEREPNPSPGDVPAGDDSPTTAWTPPPNGTDIKPIPAPGDPPQGGGRRSRLRLGVAAVVTVLILGGAATAIILTAGRSAPPTLASYVAADDVAMYGEFHLDLPGDQKQNLGAFLARFPGLGDQPIEERVNDALNDLVDKASKGKQDWTTDIEPWFDGTIGVVLTPDALESAADPGSGASTSRFGTMLFSVKDGAKAQAWLTETLAEADATAADYKGTQLQYVGESPQRVAIGVYAGQVLLFGDETTVHKAIDQGGKGVFGDDERFKAARAAFSGDSLGFVYLDFRQYVSKIIDQGAGAATNPCLGADDAYLDMIPEWMMSRFRVEADGLAFDIAFPHPESAPGAENRLSRLAPHLPASTIALFEVHDVGPTILGVIDQCRSSNPEIDAAIKEVEPQLQILGGLDGVLEWMGDVGVVVTRGGDHVDGGLVISTANRADADRLLGFVSSALQLGGSSMGFNVRDEEYAGTTVTILDFGEWQDLAALAGTPPGEIPFEGRFEIGYAIRDDFVVLGLGDAFVKSALDAGAGTSLADDARFKALFDRVGAEGATKLFVDLTAARELLEELGTSLDPDDMAAYEQEVKPWLEPFDAYVMGSRRDGQYDRSTGILTVK